MRLAFRVSDLVGSNPGVTIAGVKSGGASVGGQSHGFAVLNDKGGLRVDLLGLILPVWEHPGRPSSCRERCCGDAVAGRLIP